MDITIKKNYNDPPFSLKFEALHVDGFALPKPSGPLAITFTGDDLAKASVNPNDPSTVDFVLGGKYGQQEFRVTDGQVSAGVTLIVRANIPHDARMTEVAPAPTATAASTDRSRFHPAEGVTNAH